MIGPCVFGITRILGNKPCFAIAFRRCMSFMARKRALNQLLSSLRQACSASHDMRRATAVRRQCSQKISRLTQVSKLARSFAATCMVMSSQSRARSVGGTRATGACNTPLLLPPHIIPPPASRIPPLSYPIGPSGEMLAKLINNLDIKVPNRCR